MPAVLAPPRERLCTVYAHFLHLPAESLTKGWWHRQCGGRPRQRSVAEMEAHRRLHGAGGNCFDLALWLRARLEQAGITARIAGHDWETPDAHAAVLATTADGAEYLCDPGDLWLRPVRIDAPDAGWLDGLLLDRSVQLTRTPDALHVRYRRAGRYAGQQIYRLAPVAEADLARACDHSQHLLRRPFCERLLPHPFAGGLARWEYNGAGSYWYLADGTFYPERVQGGLVTYLAGRSGLAPDLVTVALQAYTGQAPAP